MVTQLNPMLPIINKESGELGYAFLVIDYSQEHYIMFVCAMDNGDIRTYDNRKISMQNNETLGRIYNQSI